jgi:PAS domain S-box-containing protein
MKPSLVEFEKPLTDDARQTNRELLEKALQMRCTSYLSHVKSRLLSETLFEIDQRNISANLNHNGVNSHPLDGRTITRSQDEELELKNLALMETKYRLEHLVRQRTLELESVNAILQQEIQERYQAELALRDSESKFRSLLQAAPDAIVIVDESGKIHLVNEQTEKIFGYTQLELIDQPVEILIPLPLRNAHHEYRHRYIDNPFCRLMGTGLDLFAQTKSGETIPVEVALSPLQTQQGLLITASIRDISKRKQVEEELANYRNHLEELVTVRTAALSAANKELQEYSYTISHDLRAPLRSIDGFSLALLEDYEAQLPDQAKGYLTRIRFAAQRMGTLIDEVLELARVNRCELNKDRVNLGKLSRDIIADLRLNDPLRNIKIKVAEDMYANADENLLRVVLENLLGNAWKFTSRQQVAKITLDKVFIGEETIFYIKDNGVGLNMKYANKLFGPFQRLHSYEEFPGTGVGLATVQRIIQRHGGRIWVESEPEKGATFYFTLGEQTPG